MKKILILVFIITSAWQPSSVLALTVESVPRLCPDEWGKMSRTDFSLGDLSSQGNTLGAHFGAINKKTSVAELNDYTREWSDYLAGRAPNGSFFSGWDYEKDRLAVKLAVCIAQKRILELQGGLSAVQKKPKIAASQINDNPAQLFAAANGGDKSAMIRLAELYYNNGHGTKQDMVQMKYWLRKAGTNYLPAEHKKNQEQNRKSYGAIAVYMPSPDKGTITTAMRTQEEADRSAINNCLSAYSNFHDKSCDIVVRFKSGQCGAYAAPDQNSQHNTVFGGIGLSYNGSEEEASRQAIGECIHRPGATNCEIKAVACN